MRTRHQLLTVAAAVSLGFSAAAFAASSSGGYGGSSSSTPGASSGAGKATSCEGLAGTALQTCLQQQRSRGHVERHSIRS